MGLRKWIQRRVCTGIWAVMTRLEKDVLVEFTIDIEKQAEAAIHKCACQEGNGTKNAYQKHAGDQDHKCGCMTVENLRKVEQEWIARGIIR